MTTRRRLLEHLASFGRLGVESQFVRLPQQLEEADGLIISGGEIPLLPGEGRAAQEDRLLVQDQLRSEELQRAFGKRLSSMSIPKANFPAHVVVCPAFGLGVRHPVVRLQEEGDRQEV